jgi:hypothetical protein
VLDLVSAGHVLSIDQAGGWIVDAGDRVSEATFRAVVVVLWVHAMGVISSEKATWCVVEVT